MLVKGAFEKAKEYIESHSKLSQESEQRKIKLETRPSITISRETGAGAGIVSNILVNILQKHKKKGSANWTIFDKNLIQKVLEDHRLPMHLSKFLEEDKYPAMVSMMTELLTGHPSAWTLGNKTFQTILQLAQLGNVIIIGRGGNIVTSKLKTVFHVRLFAPIEIRTKHIEQKYKLEKSEALEYIKKEDHARKKFLDEHFHKKVDDPLLYHLMLNTHLLGYELTATIISKAVMKKFPKSFSTLSTS